LLMERIKRKFLLGAKKVICSKTKVRSQNWPPVKVVSMKECKLGAGRSEGEGNSQILGEESMGSNERVDLSCEAV